MAKLTLTTHQWVTLMLAALLFFDPISKSIKSILLVALSITLILEPNYRRVLLALVSETWFKALTLLLLYATLSCIWSPATLSEQLTILQKYDKFIFLPLLVVGFRQVRSSNMTLYAFILSMLCVCLLSIGKKQGLLQWGSSDPGYVFLNHIVTGIMMSFAAYLTALFFIQEKRHFRYGWALLSLLFSYQIIFVNTGRTGYFLYLSLMGLLIFQFSTWRQLLVRMFAFMMIFTLASIQSPTIQNGLHYIVSDLHQFQNKKKDTSVGYRIEFHQYAYQRFKEHPILGNGTGSLTNRFHQDNPIPSWHSVYFQPHSQYWFIASELGLLGLLMYLGFIYTFFKTAIHSPNMRPIALGLFLIIMIGNFTDSLFYNSSAGFFLIIMMAFCLQSKETPPSSLLSVETLIADGRLRQAQQKMVKMLEVVDAICKKHHLDYWLDAGTLLGAIRHQGFIPWDDDMDIGMPRKSYEAFLQIASSELPENMFLQTAQTDKGYFNLGAPLKIRDRNSYYLEKHEKGNEPYLQSIFIDVFVYDYLPDNPKQRQRYKTLSKKLLRILSTQYSVVPMGHYAGFYRLFGYFIPQKMLEKWLQNLIQKSNHHYRTYLGRGYQCKMSNLIRHDEVYPLRRVKFESKEFNVFQHVDGFLKRQYGDYLILPPEKERTTRHCKDLIPDLSGL